MGEGGDWVAWRKLAASTPMAPGAGGGSTHRWKMSEMSFVNASCSPAVLGTEQLTRSSKLRSYLCMERAFGPGSTQGLRAQPTHQLATRCTLGMSARPWGRVCSSEIR